MRKSPSRQERRIVYKTAWTGDKGSRSAAVTAARSMTRRLNLRGSLPPRQASILGSRTMSMMNWISPQSISHQIYKLSRIGSHSQSLQGICQALVLSASKKRQQSPETLLSHLTPLQMAAFKLGRSSWVHGSCCSFNSALVRILPPDPISS